MNFVSAATWSWRALRGHSITFSALFASALLGLSVVAGFRHLLGRLGVPWLLVFLAPFFLVGYLAKREAEWVPEPAQRRKWARRLFFGSIVLSLVIAWLRPAHPARLEQPTPTAGQR